MFGTRNQQFAVIEKASRDNYEFSGKLALPGGMVRRSGQDDFYGDLKQSLKNRVLAESGLLLSSMESIELLGESSHPVTSFTTRSGKRAYVLVLRIIAAIIDDASNLVSSDNSVTGARFVDIANPPWSQFSPANCLIVHELTQSNFSSKEHKKADPIVSRAQQQCLDWRAESGVSNFENQNLGPFRLPHLSLH